jgi:hypothetical protein
MNQNDFNTEIQERFSQAQHSMQDKFDLFRQAGKDIVAEELVENIHNTPLGRLLGIIAALPEIRPEKVELGRKLLRRNESDLDEQLDEAMDRVLEELLHEGTPQ